TDKAKTTRKAVKTGQTQTQERKSSQKVGRKLSKSKSQTSLNGRRAYNGRALMDFYWIISDNLELLISSFEHFSFCLAEALCSVCYFIALKAWYATLSAFLEKSGYRRGTIDKTLFIKKDKKDIMLVQVYVDDIIFGSTKKSWCDEFEALMKSRFQMSSMGELTFFLGLQVKQKEDGIFISQDKYVAEILKKFDFMSVKTASTPIETQKPLVKDEEAADVDVHLYRSMIGSLMYLTASRPDIMFAVCACSRFQVTPKTSHLHAVKRIFRYLKGKPKLGLWYPRVSAFDLEAYSDSDYAGVNLDRKSTTRGCQFLGRRLISWQCKKQTIVATSTTEAEYVAAANCCGDAYEKKLIQVQKIHTDDNVADLLTKAFDMYFLVRWDFYENCGAHTLTLEDSTEIHTLVERKYPLTKETLERMMSLKLIAESASDNAYDLLRFIQKQIDEAGSHDGGEKDL
ncbi:putative ribonuclease H-like domain-containing protein, partial [Tanacetum coccineum]